MKTIEERKNIDSFCELIKYNKECITKENWILNDADNWRVFLRSLFNAGYESLLDVGCHDCSITREFKIAKKVGIDAFAKAEMLAKEWCEFKCMDARDIDKRFEQKSFDVVCELDFIEHLDTIAEADKLMEDMERIAKKLVVHLCPTDVVECENFNSDAYGDMSDYVKDHGQDFNPLQHHLLQPTKDYFLEKGYQVRLYGGELKKIIAWKYL